LNAFLVGDAEKPAREFSVLPEAANVPGRIDKGLLDDIEARLLVMHQFKNIDVQR
jgi:hypothetical protein